MTFSIPEFQGIKTEGREARLSSGVWAAGKPASRATGASWAQAYRPIPGGSVANYAAKQAVLASIEDQATGLVQKGEPLDLGEVLAGANESMAMADRDLVAMEQQAAQQAAQQAQQAAKAQQAAQEAAAQAQQRRVLGMVLPPLLGVGVGLTVWHHRKVVGEALLAGSVTALAGYFLSGHLASGAQTLHQSGVLGILQAGKSVAGLVR